MSDRAEDGRYVEGHDIAGPGRPTKYRDEYAEQARRYCLLGATNDRLAELFEVAPSTISLWLVQIPAFSEAVKAGREIADAEVAESLFHRARGYEHDAVHFAPFNGEVVQTPYVKRYPPDTAAATLWLKNRQPALWRDKSDLELSGKVGTEPSDALSETMARIEAKLSGI